MCLTRTGKLFHMPERMIHSSRGLPGLGLRRGAEGTRTLVAIYHAREDRARMLSRPALSNRTRPAPDESKMPVCGQFFTRPTVSDLPKRCP
jgi:hypothetical protein